MNLSSFAKSLHQARLDRAARRAYQAEQARLTELGRQRIAEFRAQDYVVHASAYTLGRTSLAGIWRLGLVTFPDGRPVRTRGLFSPQDLDTALRQTKTQA